MRTDIRPGSILPPFLASMISGTSGSKSFAAFGATRSNAVVSESAGEL